jgi:hypothetical protein
MQMHYHEPIGKTNEKLHDTKKFVWAERFGAPYLLVRRRTDIKHEERPTR